MKNIIREKTIYSGITDYIPEDIESFTQMNINKILNLEDYLPDIDEILKVSVFSTVKDSKIVKTAIGTSLEGQHLTGYKLLTEGEFSVQVNYSSDDESNGIYIHTDILYFSNATTLNAEINQDFRTISNVYIEDIYADKISSREVLLNISFIFTAENY